MNKNLIALAFALVGFGIAGLVSDFEGLSLTLGACLGGFIGYFVARLAQAPSIMLQQNFVNLGDMQGKTLNEIIAKVGQQKSLHACKITDRNGEQGYLYTWQERSYSITILFDSKLIFAGIQSETTV
jgi:hypothetical protein